MIEWFEKLICSKRFIQLTEGVFKWNAQRIRLSGPFGTSPFIRRIKKTPNRTRKPRVNHEFHIAKIIARQAWLTWKAETISRHGDRNKRRW